MPRSLPPLRAAQARFQTFEDRSQKAFSAARIKALRKILASAGFDGMLLPRADIFQGEYIPESENRLAFLTGFTGSAGFAIILNSRAALFADGRYTAQARAQVDQRVIEPVALAETTPEAWLKAAAPAGARIGYDADLFTPRGLKRFERASEEAGFMLEPLPRDPVRAIWPDRPAAPASPVMDHPPEFAGEDSPGKLARLRESLGKLRADVLLVSECPSVNWLFNLRAGDVTHLPILRAFALVPREGRPSLFVDPSRLAPDLAKRLAGIAEIVPVPDDGASEVEARLVALAAAGKRIRLDEDTVALRFTRAVAKVGGVVEIATDPILQMKARKNATEIAGARAAHLRDGAAMVRFLARLDRELESGAALTEIDAAVMLEESRLATGQLFDISFDTISAAGPHAALPHYRVNAASNRRITPGLFLIDSGGQYRDGTTDITRTIMIRRATRDMREMVTRVLKGMIAVSRAVFPKGTSGAQLDAFARAPIWAAGRDFDHGTGHGVGSFLSVHEGPQRLSKLGHAALEPGMILSNEPGYYREGAYGIRIENLIIVEPRDIPGAERAMLGFETITFCPIDRRLIVKAMLDREERAWLDAYHAEVIAKIGPLVDGADRDWLQAACKPL